MVNFNIRKLLRTAVIAAVYVALCLVLAPFSYGPVQVRVAEALTLLPIFCPEAILGLVIGCFLSNFFSGLMLDAVLGTAATLFAALLTRRLRHVRFKGLPVLASLPPVFVNAVVVGLMLSYLYLPKGSTAFAVLGVMASVGAGQVISCCFLGLLIVYAIEKSPALTKMFGGESVGNF